MSVGLLAADKEDRPSLAAGLMIGSLIILSLQDGVVKLVSADISFWQFQAVRAALNFMLLTLLARLVWGAEAPKPKRIWTVALRSLLLAGATVCFLGCAPFLSLAEMAAGLYTFPLFVVVLSALLLGERVGPRRISAIVIGFLGALLILKPGADAFQPVALMPILAGVFFASAVLTTRRLCREESPVTLAYGVAITIFMLGVAGLIATPALAPTEWTASWPFLFSGVSRMSLTVVGLIVACSLMNVTAHIGLGKAYQSAEASWLAPFDYSYLVFSALWGYALFGASPGRLTVLGMALIAGSGAYVAWRERRESRMRSMEMNRPVR